MKKLLLIPIVLAFVACGNNNAPELPGVFTVGKNKQIQFSPGLLQYRASTNTWRFADSQLDVVGEGNMKISPTYSGWIDLFGYGCTGYNDKYPWQTSDDPADYAPSRNEGITGSEYDWGTYCDIQNGGPKGSWHLMESYDWYYLLQRRPNARNLATFVYIGDLPGLVVFPDEWENTTGVNLVFASKGSGGEYEGIYADMSELTNNKISKSQWKKLEKTGAVFLPAVGWRVGQSMSYSVVHVTRSLLENSYYWLGNVLYSGAEPWTLNVDFGSAVVKETTYFSANKSNRGFFVRLVKDVK